MARTLCSVLFAVMLAACGEQAGKAPETLDLLAPPPGVVPAARLNPVVAESLGGLSLKAEAVQRIRLTDNDIRADSALRWRVGEVIPGDTYGFELTASKQDVAFGSLLRIELGYPEGSESVDCHFRVSDGALKLANSEMRAAERDGAWVFPCATATRQELRHIFATLYPAVTYSSFVQSRAVTGTIEFRTLSFSRTQRGNASGG